MIYYRIVRINSDFCINFLVYYDGLIKEKDYYV